MQLTDADSKTLTYNAKIYQSKKRWHFKIWGKNPATEIVYEFDSYYDVKSEGYKNYKAALQAAKEKFPKLTIDF